jgi:hypothetical protein
VAGRAAAALALAARLFRTAAPAQSRRYQTAAIRFYDCGRRHHGVLTTQPADFYPEKSWEQDMALAAEHLYRLTHSATYLRDAQRLAAVAGPGEGALSLYGLHGLAHEEVLPLVPQRRRKPFLEALRVDCDRAHARARPPFRLAVDPTWGTAGRACGAGTLCLLAAPLLHDPSLLDVAQAQRDYLLGCNPFGVSFLIGAGQRYPHHPHHPLAELGPLPLTGAVVGGPAPPSIREEQGFTKDVDGKAPEEDRVLQSSTLSYHDDSGDWVTNEPALDYAADALLLLAAYARGGTTRGGRS